MPTNSVDRRLLVALALRWSWRKQGESKESAGLMGGVKRSTATPRREIGQCRKAKQFLCPSVCTQSSAVLTDFCK